MADKSSRLANILKQEYQSKGIVGGLASATGKRALEKLDIRNALFGGSGVGSLIGRKIFGKGYSAINEKTAVDKISSQSAALSVDKLDTIGTNTQIAAKNSMALPSMARDMNVMRQNISKLVKLQGGTATNKADAFFANAKDREGAYEAQFGAKKQTAPTKVSEKKDDKGFLGILAGALALGVSKIFDGLKSVVGSVTGIFGTLLRILPGVTSLLEGMATVLRTGIGALLSPLGLLTAGLTAAVVAIKFFSDKILDRAEKEGGKEGRDLASQSIAETMSGAMDGNFVTGTNSYGENLAGPDAMAEARRKQELVLNAQRMEGYKTRAGVGRDTSPTKEIDAGKRQILDFIGNKEGGPAQYNALVYGNNTPKSADLTNMSIQDVMNYQSGMIARGHASTAVGRYQFLKGTLEDLVRQSGISTSEKFTPEVQDQLAGILVDRAGYQKFKEGKIGLEQFQSKLAGTWASLPKADGTSDYTGIAGNKVLTSASALQNVLMASAGGTSGGTLSQSSTQMASLTRESMSPTAPIVNVTAPSAPQTQQQAPITIASADVLDSDFGRLLARMY
jgi:muramidase (phage lysozyme)